MRPMIFAYVVYLCRVTELCCITDDDTVRYVVLRCSCAAELLRIIRSDYLNELVDIEVNGRHLQPTKCLPWCVHVCACDCASAAKQQ